VRTLALGLAAGLGVGIVVYVATRGHVVFLPFLFVPLALIPIARRRRR
jgi:hypothetical protein